MWKKQKQHTNYRNDNVVPGQTKAHENIYLSRGNSSVEGGKTFNLSLENIFLSLCSGWNRRSQNKNKEICKCYETFWKLYKERLRILNYMFNNLTLNLFLSYKIYKGNKTVSYFTRPPLRKQKAFLQNS